MKGIQIFNFGNLWELFSKSKIDMQQIKQNCEKGSQCKVIKGSLQSGVWAGGVGKQTKPSATYKDSEHQHPDKQWAPDLP